MVIVYLNGGVGNQLFQYAAGFRLARKLNTELKLDVSYYDHWKNSSYVLNSFNVKESFATPEEIKRVQQLTLQRNLPSEVSTQIFVPEVLDYPDDSYLLGCWENEMYFADVAPLLPAQFTLKNPLSDAAQQWKEKILAEECSISLHIRHGDFVYSPTRTKMPIFAALPLNYYYTCIETLRQQYKNLKLFVFSNNLHWVKKNLHTDIPTEFVCGEGLADYEELYLMSLCKHNIIANSTFSWWAAWLNQNPDKKVFVPIPASFFGTKKFYRHFSAERDENSPLQSERWIRVPFDVNNQPDVSMKPYFSLLLVVNDDAATIQETLESILNLDYKFYEVIIIDNASTDGSDKFCRQAVQICDKVTFVTLWDKVSNGAAWNKALDLAQGDFVIFLKGNDLLFTDALSTLYEANEVSRVDIVHSVQWIRENDRGDIDLDGRKFSLETKPIFPDFKGDVCAKLNKSMILEILSNKALPLAAKVFKREFLTRNDIRFKENIDDDENLIFLANAMLQSGEMIFTPKIFYIAPKNL